ncbi:MAG: hypothetical protein M3P50_09435, partial [Actinomycetota bacterium]|nr:hypothetical protein [Actinomycetota bacterium]
MVSGLDQAWRTTAYVVAAALIGVAAAGYSPALAQSPGGAEAQEKPAPEAPPAKPERAPRKPTGGAAAGPAPRLSRLL